MYTEVAVITLPIDPYYNRACDYYHKNIHPLDTILFYSHFHLWMKIEYNVVIVVPWESVDYFEFSSLEDCVAFKLAWS